MKTAIGLKTDFSLGESVVSIKQLIETAATLELEAVVIADTNSVNTLPNAFKLCKEKGIKAVVGCSFDVVDDITWRKAGKGEAKKAPNAFFRPCLYPINEAGLKDIMLLLTVANNEDHFYFSPKIDLADLIHTINKGNVVCTSGSVFSVFAHKEHKRILNELTANCDASQLYIEIMPVCTPYYDRVNMNAMEWWLDKNNARPGLVRSRPVFNEKGRVDVRNTMNCILSRAKLNEMWRNEPAEDLHIMSETEQKNEMQAMKTRLLNIGMDTNDIAQCINEANDGTALFPSLFSYEWAPMPISLPNMSADPFKRLVELTRDGWRKRIQQKVSGYQPPIEELGKYKDRLKYELSVLKAMGFENYFLLVQDLVEWCDKQEIIVGPGRGCFLPDQAVICYSQVSKQIQDVRVGDIVIAHDGSEQVVVTTLCYDCNEDVVELEFDDGRIVRCTKDHEIYTENRGWVRADSLTKFDEFKDVLEKNIQARASST